MKNISIILLAILAVSLTSCGQYSNSKMESYIKANSSDTTIPKDEVGWKNKLTDQQYYVLRQKGTERPFTGELLLNKEKGTYKCAGCGADLFTDDMKFDSECGWPSFDKEIAGGKILKTVDNSNGMSRTEITCAKCRGHLGHIFDDGPTATGQRYCVNSASLSFEPVSKTTQKNKPVMKTGLDTITLGGGCFWCVEAVYEGLIGVVSVESGYSGGKKVNPTYQEVSSQNTGHAEVTQIVYDRSKTNLDEIFQVFFSTHDPTTINRQGSDKGTQYRSVIFYKNNEQKEAAESIVKELNAKVYDDKIVTQVEPFNAFYKAEDYHQNYYANNKSQPYCQMVVREKVEKFEKLFNDRLKK